MNNHLIGEVKKRVVIPRSAFYSYISKYGIEAIECLVYLMRNSKNESVQLGAAKVLLNKCLPDLKAQEPPADNDKKIFITLVHEQPINN